jgi:glycosyltransferase involved in cell wall biosynthesis
VLAVPVDDDVALAEAILKMLKDRDLRKAYALNARRYVEENLSPRSALFS